MEFLTPDSHDASRHYHNPYTTAGARSILRRFRDDVINMLEEMEKNHHQFEGGKTLLAHSPLRSKIFVAAAMKTAGFVEEHPTKNGACGLVLTEKAIRQINDLRKYL